MNDISACQSKADQDTDRGGSASKLNTVVMDVQVDLPHAVSRRTSAASPHHVAAGQDTSVNLVRGWHGGERYGSFNADSDRGLREL